MKIQLLVTALLITVSFYTTSCVSVSVSTPKISHAKGVAFSSPSKPFVHFNASHVDRAWKNPANGNSISYVTECTEEGSSPEVESVIEGLFSSLREMGSVSRTYPKINGITAVRQSATGKVDGTSTNLDVVAFRDDDCLYIINYVSFPDSHSDDLGEFNNFLQEFRHK